MTAEKTLTLVNAAIAMLSPEDKETFASYSRTIAKETTPVTIDCTAGILAYLKTELERDIADETAKKSGKPNYRKALEHIYCNVDSDAHPNLAGLWIDAENRACACDGFHAIRLANANNLLLAGLSTVSAADAIDIDRILPAPSPDAEELSLPTIAELKAFIKTARAEYAAIHNGKRPKHIVYLFSDGVTHVNASYLLDILTAFGDDANTVCTTTHIMAEPEHCSGGIVRFKCDAGDAILLPIRTNIVGGCQR